MEKIIDDHEHDWAPLRNAATGGLSALEVCRTPGCTAVRPTTDEAQAALDDLADEAERGYPPGQITERRMLRDYPMS